MEEGNILKIEFENLIKENNIDMILQKEVNRLANKYWSNDKCKPKYIVSILYDKDLRDGKISQYIILTCKHANSSFSSVLFPKNECFYGYESILSCMKDLYNQTM